MLLSSRIKLQIVPSGAAALPPRTVAPHVYPAAVDFCKGMSEQMDICGSFMDKNKPKGCPLGLRNSTSDQLSVIRTGILTDFFVHV